MKFLLLLLISFTLIGCGGSSSSEPPKKIENTPPVLVFEPTYSVNEQTAIELSVNATDDKGIASYAWQQISGKSVELINSNTLNPNFIAPIVLTSEGEQTLMFEVVVTDNEGLSSKGAVTVNVSPENSDPKLVIEPTYSVNEQTAIELVVNATDDSAISSYAWQQVSGKSVELSNTDTSKLNFITPFVLMSDGEQALEFEVVVTDNEGATSKASSVVSVLPVNTVPVLTFESQYTVNEQSSLQLMVDASDDGGITSYAWQQMSGKPVELSNTDTSKLNFIAPTVLISEGEQTLEFEVVVTDNEGLKTRAQMKVQVTPINSAPNVTISAPDYVFSDEEITISAQATDNDGSVDSYLWQQISGPEVIITSAQQATTLVKIPQQAENQVIQLKLTVEDNEGALIDTFVELDVTSKLVLSTQESIEAKSGAFTTLEWHIDGGIEPYELTLERTDTDKTLTVTMDEDNSAYFNAPVYTEDTSIQLDLTVTDASQQSVTKKVDLLVYKAISNFSEPKAIFTYDLGGHHIYDFDIADMDNDGLSDIIALQDNGTFWYKNKGNDDIDLTPTKIRGESGYWAAVRRPYYLKQDLTQDGFLDLITIQHIEGDNNLYLLANNGKGEFLTTQLIGELSSGDISNAEVFTFNDNDITYIVAQSTPKSRSDDRRVVTFKQSENGFTQVNSFTPTGEYLSYENINLFSCRLKSDSSSDVYYETTKQGVNNGEAQLFVLSSSDGYQTPTLVKEYDFSTSFFGCLKGQGKTDRLIHYLDDQYFSEGTRRTIEIRFDNIAGGYRFDEFESVFTDSYLPYSSNFEAVDINGDNIDDLVLHYGSDCPGTGPCINSDSISNIFIRNSDSELSFKKYDASGSYHGMNLVAWDESAKYHLLKQDKNNFVLSSLVDWQDTLNVAFPKLEKIGSVEYFDKHFIVKTYDSHNTSHTQYMTLIDNMLVEDVNFNLDLSYGIFYTQADLNNDGILDMIYGYDNDDNPMDPDSGRRVTVRRLGTSDGYGPEELLAESFGFSNPLKRVIDMNNDGFLDFSIDLYNRGERWYLYEESSKTYVLNNDYYGRIYNEKQFADFNNDGLRDFVNLGEFSETCRYFQHGCGYLEVTYAQGADQFLSPKKIDERYFGIEYMNAVDIDLDGIDDLMVQAWLPDEVIYHFNWYKVQADGSFEVNNYHEPIDPNKGGNVDFGEYMDINGTDKPYFTDLSYYYSENAYAVKLYEYSQEFKKPVVEGIQLIPTSIQNYQLIDVDMDKDLDMIQKDEHNIYLLENQYQSPLR